MLKRLSVSQKLMLMLIAPIVGLVFFAALGISEKLKAVQEMSDVMEIADLSISSTSALHELQKERGYSAGYLGSKGGQFNNERQIADTDERVAKLASALQAVPAAMRAPLAKTIDPLNNGLGKLAAIREQVSAQSLTAQEAIQYYSALNASIMLLMDDLLDMVSDISARNQLGALMALSGEKENAGIERAVLTTVFADDKFSPERYRNFITVIANQEILHQDFELMASEDQRDFFRAKIVGDDILETNRMRGVAMARGLQGGFQVAAVAWYKAMTGKIDLLRTVEEKMTADVKQLAEDYQAKAKMALTLFVTLGSLAIGIAFLLAVVVGKSITQPLTVAGGAAQEISIQIVAAIQEQSATSSETATAVSQTTSTVDEIRRTSEMTVQKANVVVEVADRGAAVAKDGTRAIAHGIEAMLRIRNEVEGIARNILELSEKNLQIGNIVQSVNALAEQSNLLAVNASIEAAKAGEQGKGFAVVAGEVKALAEQSKEATAQIRTMLADIQKSSNATVMVTEQGTKRVEEGSRLIEELGKTIDAIARANNESADAARQITAAASQQMVGIEQITGAMRNIEQATRDNAAGIQQLERSAHQLRTVSDQVSNVVNGTSA